MSEFTILYRTKTRLCNILYVVAITEQLNVYLWTVKSFLKRTIDGFRCGVYFDKSIIVRFRILTDIDTKNNFGRCRLIIAVNVYTKSDHVNKLWIRTPKRLVVFLFVFHCPLAKWINV